MANFMACSRVCGNIYENLSGNATCENPADGQAGWGTRFPNDAGKLGLGRVFEFASDVVHKIPSGVCPPVRFGSGALNPDFECLFSWSFFCALLFGFGLSPFTKKAREIRAAGGSSLQRAPPCICPLMKSGW
jgi:hypothetical protein